jgi:hypothetical protein
MLTHDDWVQVFLALFGVLVLVVGGLIRWQAQHSKRLTAVETRQDEWARTWPEILREDRRRQDANFADFRTRLVRIEDKLDRKVDK